MRTLIKSPSNKPDKPGNAPLLSLGYVLGQRGGDDGLVILTMVQDLLQQAVPDERDHGHTHGKKRVVAIDT